MEDKELIKEALRFEKRLEHYNSAFGNDKEIIQRLVKRVEELQPAPKSIVWEPKKGEKYWYVDVDGTFAAFKSEHEDDRNLLIHHNVYKTQGQAEKAAKYQQRYNMVLQAVLNLEPDQVVDWKDKNQAKYGVAFDHDRGIWFYWGRCVLDKSFRSVLTDEKNVQPLLDYLNSKEKSE